MFIELSCKQCRYGQVEGRHDKIARTQTNKHETHKKRRNVRNQWHVCKLKLKTTPQLVSMILLLNTLYMYNTIVQMNNKFYYLHCSKLLEWNNVSGSFCFEDNIFCLNVGTPFFTKFIKLHSHFSGSPLKPIPGYVAVEDVHSHWPLSTPATYRSVDWSSGQGHMTLLVSSNAQAIFLDHYADHFTVNVQFQK